MPGRRAHNSVAGRRGGGGERRGERTGSSKPVRKRLRANVHAMEYEEEEAWTVPTRWVKFVVAIFLLPVCWVFAETFFGLLAREAIHGRFWATEPFWFFGLGFLLWLITFVGLPKPVVLYVFGHELTHAIWVWLMGGRVTRFEVTGEGGHVVTNKSNFLISLAPYFFPLYTMVVILYFGIGGLLGDLSAYHRLFYALIGATWGFHITFTCWLIPKEQPDLTEHGTFFSLVVIVLMNILVLSVFLIPASPGTSWAEYGVLLMENASEFAALIVAGVRWLIPN